MSAPPADGATEPRERLRLESTGTEAHPDGRLTATVKLEWRGRSTAGTADGFDTREGVMRLGAEGTVAAVSQLLPGDDHLELLGVKATRAFGTWVCMAYVRVDVDGRASDLLGARALEDDDLVRGGAVAVLDALNRVLARRLE